MDARAGLDNVEKRKFLTLPGLELRPLCRPARSQSLYRMSYPGSFNTPNIQLSKTPSRVTLILRDGILWRIDPVSSEDFKQRALLCNARNFRNNRTGVCNPFLSNSSVNTCSRQTRLFNNG
jgi:hypothetical protein